MKRIRKIVGEKCYLAPLMEEDAETYTQWMNDAEVSQYLSIYAANLSLSAEKEFIKNMQSAQNDFVFGIIDSKTDSIIGNVGLHHIDRVNRHAEFGIAIGDKSYWGKGYGREATTLILDYGFNVQNLNSIYLRVYALNPRAIETYKKCGFKPAGTFREQLIRGNKKADVLLMDILASEFRPGWLDR